MMNSSIFQYIIDVITLTTLFTLSIYHFIIYWGRKKYTEEHYNLYFSSFSAFAALYLFFESPMFVLQIVTNNIYGDWIPPAEGLSVLGIFYSFTSFFSSMVNFPDSRKKYIKFGLYYLAFALSLTLSSLFRGWNWFNVNVNNIVIILTAAFIIFITVLYARWLFEKKLFRNKNFKIIVTGICILVFYLLGVKLAEILYYPFTFRGNNFIITGVVFLFAYTLAEKFNMEYEELVILKENLEQKIAERTNELLKANERVEAVSKERSDFFINLAHETKTPLTIISNYLESYINKYGINEEIGVIKRNIDKMCNDMVNFLDLEKLIKGQLDFHNDQAVCFSELLNEKISVFREYARSKGIRLSEDINTNIYVKGDPYVADRIIFNLIENAVKYTPAGGEIIVNLKSENNEIIFLVSDTGIGIPETKLSNIFEPYYQASHYKNNNQGIGIGLYVVKRSIELLNGSVSVSSVEDKGTAFTVKLPLYSAKSDENKISYTPAKHFIPELKLIEKDFDPQKKSVMIVEDNADMLNYLLSELSVEYNVLPAKNGIDAVTKLANMDAPDFIISDIMMDKMDGEEFYNKIKNTEGLRNIPFLFLTAKTQQEQKVKMLESGAIDYIYKPFSITELKARIRTITENMEKQKKEGLKQAIELISRQVNKPENLMEVKQVTFEERCRQYELTSRQKEIVTLVAEGLEYKEIADKLNISPKTILNHITILFNKLDVHNKVDLINKLYR